MLTVSSRSNVRRSVAGICVAAGLALAADAGHASLSRHPSFITFSQPVALPGRVLAAGEYMFEIANENSSHHVVRVSTRKSREPLYMALTLRVERPRPVGEVVSFHEAPRGAAAPIRAWYPDGLRVGHEFIYP